MTLASLEGEESSVEAGDDADDDWVGPAPEKMVEYDIIVEGGSDVGG